MTAETLNKVCQTNNYIILRLVDNSIIALNCRCAEIAKRRNAFNGKARTLFVSFKSCTFQEYISHKTPFL